MNDDYAEQLAYQQWADEQAGIENQWKQYGVLYELVTAAEDTQAYMEMQTVHDTD